MSKLQLIHKTIIIFVTCLYSIIESLWFLHSIVTVNTLQDMDTSLRWPYRPKSSNDHNQNKKQNLILFFIFYKYILIYVFFCVYGTQKLLLEIADWMIVFVFVRRLKKHI